MLISFRAFTDRESGFFATARIGLFNKTMRTISRYVEEVSHRWSIRYQLRQSENLEKIDRDVTLDVPPEEISFMLYDSIINGKANPGRIEITCSLSDDLQDISVMHSTFRVLQGEGNVDIEERGIQILDCSQIEAFIKAWDQDVPLRCISHSHWTWTSFSPYGYYFVAFERNGRLTLYEESPFRSNRKASWKYMAQIDFVNDSVPIFHPHQSLICLLKEYSTFIWSSKSPGIWNLHKILSFELKNAKFTRCGQYLKGYRSEGIGSQQSQEESISLSLSTIMDDCYSQNNAKGLGRETIITAASQEQWQLEKSHIGSEIVCQEEDHDRRQKLEQYEIGAAIIWKTPAKERKTVLRLPQSLASVRMNVTATRSEKDKSRIFVHIDKAQQQTYDLRTPEKEQFPMSLERHTNTLTISKSCHLQQQPKLMQKAGKRPRSREDEKDDSGLARIPSDALISKVHSSDWRRRPDWWYTLLSRFERRHDPSYFFSREFLSELRVGLPRNAFAPVMMAMQVRAARLWPMVAVEQRKNKPLLLGPPENSIQSPTLSVSQNLAKIQYRQDKFPRFDDFGKGLFCGIFCGLLLGLLAFWISVF